MQTASLASIELHRESKGWSRSPGLVCAGLAWSELRRPPEAFGSRVRRIPKLTFRSRSKKSPSASATGTHLSRPIGRGRTSQARQRMQQAMEHRDSCQVRPCACRGARAGDFADRAGGLWRLGRIRCMRIKCTCPDKHHSFFDATSPGLRTRLAQLQSGPAPSARCHSIYRR